ncbi:MAG: CopG family transcriptional regulator [Candidatus Dojkabacteria bacterium]|nr:CopG family transcriptional regulator [Candidatus Dojkabacteria bacterium]MDQ7020373.1 CopG family transcriptional regulator [Candidatus Dojkabacteria bacterium]
MKVLVIYSINGVEENKENFSFLKKYVSDYDGVELVAHKNKEILSGKAHFKGTKKVIQQADAIIIDNSHSSFRLGYEASIALNMHKPVLILSKEKDYSEFIQHPSLFGAKYNDTKGIKDNVDKFLNNVHKKMLSIRFNMYISKEQEEAIAKKASTEGLTKSEIIRILIDEHLVE